MSRIKGEVWIACDVHSSRGNKKLHQEWESKESIDFLESTIQEIGYNTFVFSSVDRFKALFNAISRVKNSPKSGNPPIVFNLVEGYGSRNRESYIPTLCEFAGIIHTGSDGFAQAVSLDKKLTKKIVSQTGIRVPAEYTFRDDELQKLKDIKYPILIKPNGEGSSAGIDERNICKNKDDVLINLKRLNQKHGDLLIEEFLSGPEYTCSVLGNYPDYLWVAPVQVLYEGKIYSELVKSKYEFKESLNFQITKPISRKIAECSIQICQLLKVNGYSRLDFRMDANGNLFFLEINLTPGLSFYYSVLPKTYIETRGSYKNLVSEILELSIESFQEKRFNYGKGK